MFETKTTNSIEDLREAYKAYVTEFMAAWNEQKQPTPGRDEVEQIKERSHTFRELQDDFDHALAEMARWLDGQCVTTGDMYVFVRETKVAGQHIYLKGLALARGKLMYRVADNPVVSTVSYRVDDIDRLCPITHQEFINEYRTIHNVQDETLIGIMSGQVREQ